MAASELSALQAALIAAFERAESPEEALELLRQAALPEAAQRWIETCDPRSLATAIALVRRWGARDPAQ